MQGWGGGIGTPLRGWLTATALPALSAVLALWGTPILAEPEDAPAPPSAAAAVSSPTGATAGHTESGLITANGVSYSTEDNWELAGYNLEEIIYTVFITNHDTRILRCRTQMHGRYIEDGKVTEISDMQLSTLLPDQRVQVGTWIGLDQKSGATYSVTCKSA
jgi:hypothetical protein